MDLLERARAMADEPSKLQGTITGGLTSEVGTTAEIGENLDCLRCSALTNLVAICKLSSEEAAR
jgi:hypothetical protein